MSAGDVSQPNLPFFHARWNFESPRQPVPQVIYYEKMVGSRKSMDLVVTYPVLDDDGQFSNPCAWAFKSFFFTK